MSARLRWQPFALIAAIGLTIATIWLAVSRYGRSSEQKELFAYFQKTFPAMHAQTRSIQGAIAGLVAGDTVPTAEGAVALLDRNIVPSLDNLIDQCKAVMLEGVEVRALHAAYLEAVQAMRADAVAMTEIFSRQDLSLAEKRNRAQERVKAIGPRFDAFSARAVQVMEANGIRAAASADAAPP